MVVFLCLRPYNLGRADAIKEHKREISDGKVDRIIKRNKAINQG